MQQQIANLCKLTEELSDEDDDDLDDEEASDDDGVGEAFNERKCETKPQVETKSVKKRMESDEPNGSDVEIMEDGLNDDVC